MEKWYFENFAKVKTVVFEKSMSKLDLKYTVHTSIIKLNYNYKVIAIYS